MLGKAKEIVDKEENASVVVFFPNIKAAILAAEELANDFLIGEWREASLTYESATGSRLLFRVATEDQLHYLSGMQITHMFDMGVGHVCRQYLSSRVRSARYKGNAPMGVYTPYGAQIWIDY